MHPIYLRFCLITSLVTTTSGCLTEHHAHHDQLAKHANADTRQPVKFPEQLRAHTMTNMRDHLLALQQIQEALSKLEYSKAADIAETRLGMTSLKAHGAHDVAKFMPQDMQTIGTSMHRGASQFAITAQDAMVTDDMKSALAALSKVTASCVACHAAYRLQ